MWKLHCFLLTYISLRNLLVLLLLVLAVLLVVSEHGGRPEQAASKS